MGKGGQGRAVAPPIWGAVTVHRVTGAPGRAAAAAAAPVPGPRAYPGMAVDVDALFEALTMPPPCGLELRTRMSKHQRATTIANLNKALAGRDGKV